MRGCLWKVSRRLSGSQCPWLSFPSFQSPIAYWLWIHADHALFCLPSKCQVYPNCRQMHTDGIHVCRYVIVCVWSVSSLHKPCYLFTVFCLPMSCPLSFLPWRMLEESSNVYCESVLCLLASSFLCLFLLPLLAVPHQTPVFSLPGHFLPGIYLIFTPLLCSVRHQQIGNSNSEILSLTNINKYRKFLNKMRWNLQPPILVKGKGWHGFISN